MGVKTRFLGFAIAAITPVLGHTIALAQTQPVAIVLEGTVEVKRENSRGYVAIGKSQNIFLGDLVRVKSNSSPRAKIRCLSNQLEWFLPDDGAPRGISNFCS